MQVTRPLPLSASAVSTAQRAKAALLRLAVDKLEPTPENYARAWRQESGDPAATSASADDGPALAALIERIVTGLERSSRGWTSARKKDGLKRVLAGSRSDGKRLQHRLGQLLASWDGDLSEAESTAAGDNLGPLSEPAVAAETVAAPLDSESTGESGWARVIEALVASVQQALPVQADAPHPIAARLAAGVARIASEGVSPAAIDELEAACREAAPVLAQRHNLLEQLTSLCAELTASLTALAENDSWARGQCEAMQLRIEEGLTVRGIRAVSELLRDTRARQGRLRDEREQAREALKGLINQMLGELGELGSQTGQFHNSVGRYADVIENADSLESLAGAVREMVEESRSVHALVQQTQARLRAEHGKAQGLTQRVSELESEMQRLSSEVSTDQLTQIANRRGLMQAFEVERARLEREPASLAVGLLDIDNFKRLNDDLGHQAGDEALKSLAARVSGNLRPTDHVARYGGEEFVVLLPATPAAEAQEILTRMQRSLTGGLFMHEQKQVFVTFSAGVTVYRPGERIEDALERADQALYAAKRTGKNRTCLG